MALPTYTPKFGECCLPEVYDMIFAEFLYKSGHALAAREPLVSQFHEKLNAILPKDVWIIHGLAFTYSSYNHTSTNVLLIDNKLNYYSVIRPAKCGYGGHPTGEYEEIQCSIQPSCSTPSIIKEPSTLFPLSDKLITAVKKVSSSDGHMKVRNSVCSDTTIPTPFIISTTLESYRAHASTEFILFHQVKALEEVCTTNILLEKRLYALEPYRARTEGLLHEQAKALEESRAMNKMLEARLSVLEAFLAPKPTPPKEVDLLNLSDPGEPPTLSVTEIT
jgi:hypothetical protein